MAFNLGFLLMLSLTQFFISGSRAQPGPGTIVEPQPGATIAPGAQFNFSYLGRADYGVSSYNFHVWLVGEQQLLNGNPGNKDLYTTGWYFGVFDYENWPAVPYSKNPAPSQFTMPDFSESQGGWGVGKNGSNVKFHLVVYEEYDDGFGAIGRKIGTASNEIIYNATVGRLGA